MAMSHAEMAYLGGGLSRGSRITARSSPPLNVSASTERRTGGIGIRKIKLETDRGIAPTTGGGIETGNDVLSKTPSGSAIPRRRSPGVTRRMTSGNLWKA
jgi:hypothetical protein